MPWLWFGGVISGLLGGQALPAAALMLISDSSWGEWSSSMEWWGKMGRSGIGIGRSRWPISLQHSSPSSAACWQWGFLTPRQKQGHLPHPMYDPQHVTVFWASEAKISALVFQMDFIESQCHWGWKRPLKSPSPTVSKKNSEFQALWSMGSAGFPELPSFWKEPFQKNELSTKAFWVTVCIWFFSMSTKMKRPQRHYLCL